MNPWSFCLAFIYEWFVAGSGRARGERIPSPSVSDEEICMGHRSDGETIRMIWGQNSRIIGNKLNMDANLNGGRFA